MSKTVHCDRCRGYFAECSVGGGLPAGWAHIGGEDMCPTCERDTRPARYRALAAKLAEIQAQPGDDEPEWDVGDVPPIVFRACEHCGVTPADETTSEHGDHDTRVCALLAERDAAMAIVRALAAQEPMQGAECDEGWVRGTCMYCDASPYDEPVAHAADCVWRRAKELVGG